MSLAFDNIFTFFSLFSYSLFYSFSHIVLPPLLLLSTNSLLRTFSGSGVRLSFLSSYRETSSVSDTSVASDFHESLDVHVDISSEVTLYHVIGFDNFSDFTGFFLSKILELSVSGMMPVLAKIFLEVGQPIPYI